ncbi:hypothetical protein [Geobacillus sp. GHH01]|uniref:hypothetical protein n=1 Tax=Geobacillus sp. GHH01 TaxID=1233873 RepID=UPI00191BE6CF|nr:hypothetical protein [Geobacillus sp. GHH01]
MIDLAYLAWDIVFVTLFWPLVLGPFWKRISTPAVWASVSVGILYYVITSIVGVPGPVSSSEGFLGLLSELWHMPVFSGTIISGITIVLVSYLIPPSHEVVEIHKRERRPTDEELEQRKTENNLSN